MSNNTIKLRRWLYPISLLYGFGVWLRNKLFDWNVLKERSFPLPVISVGNITVGGTGKTPHTEYLIRLLSKDYQVAVLSRGYKRKSKGFVLSTEESSVSSIGDEPYQMKHKYPHVHVAVDANRCHGIEKLCSRNISPETDIVLLDDAFQHRYVKPGMNILLVNYHQLICNDMLLPAGNLRESLDGKNRAKIVIVTKCPDDITPIDMRVLTKQMNLYPYQQLYFTTFKYGQLYPLNESGKSYPLNKINSSVNILVVSGIASPSRLLNEIEKYNQHVSHIGFSDHHDFSAKDIEKIQNQFLELPQGLRMIITTEKDAARLKANSNLSDEIKPYIYVLPIEVKFLQDQQEAFNAFIHEYVRRNLRNSPIT